jgi:hypothetical protein
MTHVARFSKHGLIGALAMLVAGITPAAAGPGLQLSDTITIKGASCVIVSVANDIEVPPEFGKQKCVFTGKLNGAWRVDVPGNKDEIIICSCKVGPNGVMTGVGRENQGPGAYSVTITGKVSIGAAPTAVIRVWEKPGSP